MSDPAGVTDVELSARRFANPAAARTAAAASASLPPAQPSVSTTTIGGKQVTRSSDGTLRWHTGGWQFLLAGGRPDTSAATAATVIAATAGDLPGTPGTFSSANPDDDVSAVWVNGATVFTLTERSSAASAAVDVTSWRRYHRS
jgi:hypothetical protein